jgi:dUTP pyrophosphatase
MDPKIVKIKKLHPDAIVPAYATDGAGCFDFHACMLPHWGQRVEQDQPSVIETGLSFEIPKGFVMLIFSRSGHAFNSDVRLANCVGVIDSDYRGEVKIKLASDANHAEFLTISNGDRIAQGMIVSIPRIMFDVVGELGSTKRGEGGFGSTGSTALNVATSGVFADEPHN